MIRRDVVNRGGEVLHRNYDQPDGYADPERTVRSDWRALWITTLPDQIFGSPEPEPEPALRVVRRRSSQSIVAKQVRSKRAG